MGASGPPTATACSRRARFIKTSSDVGYADGVRHCVREFVGPLGRASGAGPGRLPVLPLWFVHSHPDRSMYRFAELSNTLLCNIVAERIGHPPIPAEATGPGSFRA